MAQQTEIHEKYDDGTGNCFHQTTTKPSDGTPAHFSHVIREYLDVPYPNRWMGRAEPVAWPPRSPDLNPVDFYLWGRLKTLVYATEIANVAVLQQRIENGCPTVRNEVNGVCNIQRAVRRRAWYCVILYGRHFEHVVH